MKKKHRNFLLLYLVVKSVFDWLTSETKEYFFLFFFFLNKPVQSSFHHFYPNQLGDASPHGQHPSQKGLGL